MAVSGEIDRGKLQRSLRRFAKDFGDSNAQAICRWGVSACREAAKQTQVWGDKAKDARDKQERAMYLDAYRVFDVRENAPSPRNKRAARTPDEVNDWIEINRTRRRGRTARIPVEERMAVSRAVFEQAMKERIKRAGMAKGGFLGAGIQISKHQRGAQKLAIGKNFLGYAQKFAHFGRATFNPSGSKPFGLFSNLTRHSANKHVVKTQAIQYAMDWGLKKTISWYRRALKAQDKKKP